MTEFTLQKKFLSVLGHKNTPWGILKYAQEFNFIGGRADIIAIDRALNLYTFEIKLERWKIALSQAYKNTSFANKSFVVLPKNIALRAVRHNYQFNRRDVGLCYLDGDKIIKLIDCNTVVPVMSWLNSKALTLFDK